MPQPPLQALHREITEVVLDGRGCAVSAKRRREIRQPGLTQGQAQVAAPGDVQRVLQRRGQVGKQRVHVGRGAEPLLTNETLDAPRVGQHLALGDADAGLVGVEVLGLQELHRVRGHHWQAQLGRQRHAGLHQGLLPWQAGALQFDVEAPGETGRQALGESLGSRRVARQQGLAQGAVLRSGQGQQARRRGLQPLPLHPGLRLLGVGGPRPGQQLAEIEVALRILHQHQQPRGLPFGAFRLHPQVGPDQRLDALLAAGLVQLHGAEQVGQVGDGQRRLTVTARCRHGVIDAQGAIDHGELGVRAQVDEAHRLIVGSGRDPAGTWPEPGLSPHCDGADA